jgi:hypothetical protein
VEAMGSAMHSKEGGEAGVDRGDGGGATCSEDDEED